MKTPKYDRYGLFSLLKESQSRKANWLFFDPRLNDGLVEIVPRKTSNARGGFKNTGGMSGHAPWRE